MQIFAIRCPTLLIHGNADHIIPISEARQLLQASGAPGSDKRLLVIEGAGHNTLLRVGLDDYLAATEKLVSGARQK